jgi:predicted tellurium resistance membrane protein TerC
MSGQRRSGIGSGIILLGIGPLIITGWWWPGIMLVLGLAFAVERLLQGRTRDAVVVAVIFIGIPLLISTTQHIHIPATWAIGFIVAALGVGVLVRAISNDA